MSETLNNYIDSVVVISLPKRLNYIKNAMREMNIQANYFDAIKGSDLNRLELINQGILHKNHEFKNNNEIGCALSHLTVINNFLNSPLQQTICVFEDDIAISKDYLPKVKNILKNLPKDWEFVNLGRCWGDCFNQKKINDYIFKMEISLCSHSYILNKKGAKKIIYSIYPLKKPIDIEYIELMNGKTGLKFYNSERIFEQIRTNSELSSSLNNTDPCWECNLPVIYHIQYNWQITVLIIILVFFVYFMLRKKIK